MKQLKKLFMALAISLGSVLIIASCAPLPLTSASSDNKSGESGEDYLIGPEDVLSISVWKESGLDMDILVRPDGGISFPLVGDIKAAGKTAADVQKEISTRLVQFIPDPVVTVVVQKIASYKIYVVGKVNKPGEYLAGRYMDVLQALSMAGGLTPFAAENDIKILRKEDGKETVFPFEYGKLRSGKALQQNIRLKSGDTVIVP